MQPATWERLFAIFRSISSVCNWKKENPIWNPNREPGNTQGRISRTMDRDWGSKPGSGGAASAQTEAMDRRERLRRLALETIDLAKDPYFMRNHLGRYWIIYRNFPLFFLKVRLLLLFKDWKCFMFLGSYECKLCLTLHNNEGNYLAHTQGKRHQTNLAKRAAREAKEAPAQPQPHKRKVSVRKTGTYLSASPCSFLQFFFEQILFVSFSKLLM